METQTSVPKSFGCIPHKNLRLSFISRSRSKPSSSSFTSNNNFKSPPRTSSSGSKIEDEYREVFRRFDSDNDGKISAYELRNYFGSIGDHMSHEDAQAVIADLDSDGDHLIDFQDFLRLMMEKDVHDQDRDQDLKAAFETFELEKGSGRITPRSLQRVLSRLGDEKSYDECVAMITVFDTHGKGELGYHEFHQMMMASS